MRTPSVESISSRRAASLALLALPLAVAACGASKAADRQAKQECETRAENAAAFAVARAAFNSGALGKSTSLTVYFKGVPRSAYLDTGDALRSWSTVSRRDDTRFAAESWMGHLEGSGAPVGARMYDARMRVRRTGSANC